MLPLLDGSRTVGQLLEALGGAMAVAAVGEGLVLLTRQGWLVDALDEMELPSRQGARLRPQCDSLGELGTDEPGLQVRLAQATVAVLGLGGVGAAVAAGLAAAGVGTLRCVDAEVVTAADAYLASAYGGVAVGTPRAEALRGQLLALNPEVNVEACAGALGSDADVRAVVEGADVVVCCVDPGLIHLAYKLNRVCLQLGVPWTSGVASAWEGIVGPTVRPGETACFLCYKMRSVACAEDPEAAFEAEQALDRRRRDDSATRPNLTFGVGIVGNMVGLEALKLLLGAPEPAALGRIIAVDFVSLATTKHTVLRKPWCPACFSEAGDADTKRDGAAAP